VPDRDNATSDIGPARRLPPHQPRSRKDPDSAKFADLFASRGSPRIICGLINAKNGHGGYTGMTPFTYYADTDKAVIAQGLSNGETIRALKTWQQECRPYNGCRPTLLRSRLFSPHNMARAEHHRYLALSILRLSPPMPSIRPTKQE